MSPKTKAAILLHAAAKATKAGSKVEACERRLAKLVRERERAEAEYLKVAAETLPPLLQRIDEGHPRGEVATPA